MELLKQAEAAQGAASEAIGDANTDISDAEGDLTQVSHMV